MTGNGVILSNDSIYLKSLCGKLVEVTTIDNKVHLGKVYVVDPMSTSVILVNKKDDKLDSEIIMGHAVKSIKCCADGTTQEFFHSSQILVLNEENLLSIKNKVKSWLNKNFISFNEDGWTLKIDNDLIIEPPYGKEQCYSSNTIILERVINLLSKMPDD